MVTLPTLHFPWVAMRNRLGAARDRVYKKRTRYTIKPLDRRENTSVLASFPKVLPSLTVRARIRTGDIKIDSPKP